MRSTIGDVKFESWVLKFYLKLHHEILKTSCFQVLQDLRRIQGKQ